jgi:hypothetical protein
MDNQTDLSIQVSAVDNASAVLQGVSDKLGSVKTAAESATTSWKDIGGTMTKVGAELTVAGGALLAPLALFVQHTAEAQDKMTQFNTIVDNVKGSTDAVKEKMLEASDAFRDLGFDSEDTAVALARFYQRTNDVTQAIQYTKDAMDLARFKNEDLGTAITQINMVLSGQGKILSQVGINLKDLGHDGAAGMKELEGIIGGSALNASKNFNEEVAALNAHLDDLYISLGSQIVPILTRMVEAIKPVVDHVTAWISTHQKLTQTILIGVGALGVLMVVVGTLAVAIGGIILLFTTVAGVIAGVVTLAIIGIGISIYNLINIVLLLQKDWDDVWSGMKIMAQEAWDWIDANVIQPMMSAINGAFNALKSLTPSSIGGAVVGGLTNFGHALGFAEGGIVTRPTLAMVGEGGESEAIIPLSKMNSMGGGITVNVNGGTYLSEDSARQLGNMIVRNLMRVSRVSLQ